MNSRRFIRSPRRRGREDAGDHFGSGDARPKQAAILLRMASRRVGTSYSAPQRSRARSIGSRTRTSDLPRLLVGLATVIRAWPIGGVTAVAASPLVVLVAQAFSPDLATASFDAASPHYPWFVGCISIAAASPFVVFKAQAFCFNLAAASFDCAYGYPRSVGGIAIVLPRPNVVLVAQAVRDDLAPHPSTLQVRTIRGRRACS
jgi:hypothetical protein